MTNSWALSDEDYFFAKQKYIDAGFRYFYKCSLFAKEVDWIERKYGKLKLRNSFDNDYQIFDYDLCKIEICFRTKDKYLEFLLCAT